jgi:lysozyme
MATDKQKRIAAATAIATAIAVPAEGLRQFAYYDPPGILTVCYGHTGNDIIKGRKYSIPECDKFLSEDMRAAINTVERCIPGLPVNVLAAFADAVYNLGPTIACSRTESTAARYLLQGKLIDACNQLPRWNKARVMGAMIELPGLTKRRGVEKEVCLTGLT